MDIRNRQSVVIKFLTEEGSSPTEIYRRLRCVCGEDAIDVSSVRRCDICDRPRSGRPATAVMMVTKERVDMLL